MSPIITKADGTMEPFNAEKLINSLVHAGASADIADSVTEEVTQELKEGMSTHEIYSRAFNHLREHRRSSAARYSLKRALLELGPSGFPFESYLSEIFATQGYHVATDQHIQGKCVEHEVDVVLRKDGEVVFVEAKFHNTIGFKTDLQVALYVQARLEDIEDGLKEELQPTKVRGMLITNTKFTSLAIQYAKCRGIELIGWEYPPGNNLYTLIEGQRLYPITALTSLTHEEKNSLISSQILLCRDLQKDPASLASLNIAPGRLEEIKAEAQELCLLTHTIQ